MPLDHAFLPDKEQMRRAFDKAAQQYDTAALLQREVNQRMFERLAYIKVQPQQVLDAGAGTGYATRLLQGRYPQAQLFALDIALGMLQQHCPATPSWQARLGWRKNVSYHCKKCIVFCVLMVC
jgi:malonyl-CoA O-methyltransferase